VTDCNSAEQARTPRGRKTLFAITGLMLSTLVTLLLLEVGSYVYLCAARGYDGTHLMNYEFDPYKNIRPTPNYVDTRGVRHNAQGFRRDVDTPRVKPSDTLRVFLVGGSTGYGLGSLSRFGRPDFEIIRNDETIDFYLERALASAVPGKKVEVINAAVTSFFSHHHLIYLNQTILGYDPDLILFLDGFNDYFAQDERFDQWTDYAYQERSHVFLGPPTFNALARYTGWWLFRKSHFAHLAGRALRNATSITQPTGEGRVKINVEATLRSVEDNGRRNFAKMVARNSLILANEGVDAIFALQPEIAFKQSKIWSPLEEEIYQDMVHHWPEGFIEFKNRARPKVLAILDEAASVGGAQALDLTDIYGSLAETAYTDYCHLTPDGNRVLADQIAPLIGSMLRQRVGKPVPALASSPTNQ
jgi:lysophospholipase L1-like esterase